jgi:hypothetical protein
MIRHAIPRHVAHLLLITLSAMAVASCGSDDGPNAFPRVISLGEGDVFANIVNTSLSVGPNRLLLQLHDADPPLEDADGGRILGAQVHLRVFDLNGDDPVAHVETDARFVGVVTGYVDEQSSGAREVTGSDGVYVANIDFTRPGDWGVRIAVTTSDRTFDEFPFRFTVRQRSDEPMVGDPAPPSLQATLATEPKIEEIDSSSPSRPRMHDQTIADAVKSGRPAVIAFATPAFCRSRLCAPVMDTVMDPLAAQFGNSAAFIHVEPYVLRDLRAGFVENAVPATREWKLQSEPWVFVVGRDGRIAAKFEGIVALNEVEAALRSALGD